MRIDRRTSLDRLLPRACTLQVGSCLQQHAFPGQHINDTFQLAASATPMEVPEASPIHMLHHQLAGAGCVHMHAGGADGGGAAPGVAPTCFLDAASHLGLRLKGEWLRFPLLPPTAVSPTAATGLTEFGSPTSSCEHCNGYLFIGSLFAQNLRELEVRRCSC